MLSGIYQHAGRHLGFVGANPVALLDRVEKPGTHDERPKRVLSAEELRRLLSAVEDRYRLLFELEAETGARLGEVLGIVWSEVDLEKGSVTFTHQLAKGGGGRVPLKTTRSRRTIEVTPELTAKLREAKVAAARSGPHDFVFATRTGTPHDHRNIGGRVLKRAVKLAGLEAVVRDGRIVEPAPTFHDLRHSHGSALIGAGFDMEEVSARLGHSTVATTMKEYVHEYDAARRSEQRRSRLAQLYSSEPLPAGQVVKLDQRT